MFRKNNLKQRRKRSTDVNRDDFIKKIKYDYFYYLFSSKNHSLHFEQLRAQFISNRIRLTALVLVFLLPIWSIFELFYLPFETWSAVFTIRITVAFGFLIIYGANSTAISLKSMHLRMLSLLFLCIVFYIGTISVLNFSEINYLNVGYANLPIILMVMGIIFPLTILEGGIMVIVTFIAYLFVELVYGMGSNGASLYTIQTIDEMISHDFINQIWLLLLLASMAGLAEITQLSMMMMLYRQANKDALTGLANRRTIIQFMEIEMEKCKKGKMPVSVIIADLDKFKDVNDTYGHTVGDRVLKDYADLLVDMSRKEDLVGRYGGEEFLIVLTNTTIVGAEGFSLRLLRDVPARKVGIRDLNNKFDTISYTGSMGLAEWDGNESFQALINRADEYLYSSKGAGRNCATISGEKVIRVDKQGKKDVTPIVNVV